MRITKLMGCVGYHWTIKFSDGTTKRYYTDRNYRGLFEYCGFEYYGIRVVVDRQVNWNPYADDETKMRKAIRKYFMNMEVKPC